MEISLFDGKNADEIERQLYCFNGASVFHSLHWKHVMEYSFGYPSFYVIAKNEEKIVGLLPLYCIDSLVWGRKLTSAPFNFYTDPLFLSEEALVKMLEFAKHLTLANDCNYLHIRTNMCLNVDLKRSLGFDLQRNLVTSMMSLGGGSEQVWAHIRRPRRWSIKKAMKSGVKVKIADSLLGIKSFYLMLSEVYTKIHGVPCHSLNFLMNVWKSLAPKKMAMLTMGYYNNVPVAGVFSLLFGDKMYLVWGIGKPAYRFTRAEDFVLWNVLEWGCSNHFKICDYGVTSLHHEGLMQYKQEWGTNEKGLNDYFFINKKNPINLDYYTSHTVVKALWRRMPLPLARKIGPLLAKEAA